LGCVGACGLGCASVVHVCGVVCVQGGLEWGVRSRDITQKHNLTTLDSVQHRVQAANNWFSRGHTATTRGRTHMRVP
jgi:hypothetical protein